MTCILNLNLSLIFIKWWPSSGGAPEQAPRWDLVDTESCDGGIRFLAPVLIVWGYVCIYRRKEYIGGAPRGP